MRELSKLLKLSHVPRWSIVDCFRRQSVADHSFRVVAITISLLKEIRESHQVSDSTYLSALQWALVHDAEESETGDIPTPYKVKNGLSSEPPDFVAQLVSIADVLEALIFIDRYVVVKDGLLEEHKTKLKTRINKFHKSHGIHLGAVCSCIVETGTQYV